MTTTIPTLRPYQEAALHSVFDMLVNGQNRGLVKMPTGTGKTVMFSEILKWLEPWLAGLPPAPGAKMLVIAHREELLTQARDKIQIQNRGLMVAIEQADLVASRYSDVIVASIQTLSATKFRRLKRILREHPGIRIVIVDEAHHAAADTYRTSLAHLGFLPMADASDTENLEAATHDDVEKMEAALHGWDAVAPKDRLLLGVTATPNRSDAIGLGCVFQTIAYSYALRQAILDGWLVPPVPWVIETASNLDQVRTTAGEFNQKDLAVAVNTAVRNDLAVAGWLDKAKDLPTLAFTVDVAHAHALAECFRVAGVRAEALSGETPKDQRRQILKDYTDGKITVITNCMVLTEGTDLPLTQCILHAKPTKSATLYEQMTGRGLRLYPGKTSCIVLDVVDIARRHSLQTAPVLYGLPPGLKSDGKDLETTANALEDLRQKYPNFDIEKLLAEGRFTLEGLRAKATTFDQWAIPDLGAFGIGRTMDWTKAGEDYYRMQYPWADGIEIIQVSKDLIGKWEVICTIVPAPDKDGKVAPRRQKTIAHGVLTMEAAAGMAEQYVERERRSVTKLKNKDAPWKQNPASEKQMNYLRRLKVPFNPKTLTMGQAGQLIDLAHARKGR